MKKKILVIVPTRDRPENVRELLETWKTTTLGLSDIFLGIDDDQVDMYKKFAYCHYPRTTMVGTLNTMATRYSSEYDVIGFLGDDHRFKSVGWDLDIMNVVSKSSTAIIYGNDLLQGEKLPTACFMTSNIIKVLGYMAPPTLKHMFVDDFWRDLGNALGCLHYIPDMIIEHKHFSNGKSEKDEGYQRVFNMTNSDYLSYLEYGKGQAQKDIQKVKQQLYEN